jgi:hypothetical protein
VFPFPYLSSSKIRYNITCSRLSLVLLTSSSHTPTSITSNSCYNRQPAIHSSVLRYALPYTLYHPLNVKYYTILAKFLALSRQSRLRFVLPAHPAFPTVCINSAPTGRILVKFNAGDFHKNLLIISKFSYDWTEKSGVLHADTSRPAFYCCCRESAPCE